MLTGIKELLPFVNSLYNPDAGNFGILLPNNGTIKVTWFGCRENFHKYMKGSGFYYGCVTGRGNQVAKFIHLVEDYLGLVDKSVFQATVRHNIIWVDTYYWWLENQMKFQFFSICLRASLYWDENLPWLSVLKNQVYAAPTLSAVDRFLSGYTHYTGNVAGWHKQFYGPEMEGKNISYLLIKPKYTDRERHTMISKIAEKKWKEAGCPAGRDKEFWFSAVGEFSK